MRDREQTVYDLARFGASRYDVERILRYLPAIQRAHEAACNGNGEPNHPYTAFVKRGDSAFVKVRAILSALPNFRHLRRQHDPRGACLHLWDKSTNVVGEEPTYRFGAVGFTSAELARIDRQAERQQVKS